MSLISPSEFILDINIPNTDQQSVSENVQGFIDMYETEFLEKLFGEVLYKDYTDGLAIDPIPAKWTELQENTDLLAALRRYVYWFWSENEITYTAGIGNVKAKGENSSNTCSWDKMVKAWNRMVNFNYDVAKFINAGDYGVQEPIYPFDYYCTYLLPNIYRKKNTLDI